MAKKKSVGGRKSIKIKKQQPRKEKPIYNSDDDIPDESAEDFVKDDIDVYNDELYEDDGMQDAFPGVEGPQKEAVYDFSDSEDEEQMEKRLQEVEARVRRYQRHDSSDSAESDSEDEEAKAWGKKKQDFYGADITTKVDIKDDSSEENEADAKLEEKEARILQQKLLSQMEEDDFGLDMFKTSESAPVPEGMAASKPETEKIVTDISSLSDKEKTLLLKKEYPEFLNIATDFQEQLNEYIDRISPILDLHKRQILPDSSGIDLLKWKARIILDYCTCAQFYLLLRAEKAPIEGHPVIRRMVQFKQLLKQISEVEPKLTKDLDYVLRMVADGKELEIKAEEPKIKLDKNTSSLKQKEKLQKKLTTKKIINSAPKQESMGKKVRIQSLLDDEEDDGGGEMEDLVTVNDEGDSKLREKMVETDGEKEALEFYNAMKKRRMGNSAPMDDEGSEDLEAEVDANGNQDDLDEHEKRAVTEEMKKNRGLTVKRSKTTKNPRMRNKLKYQKKKKIHKTIVPEVLKEFNRYSGEASGIRAGRIRSVQLS